MPRSGRICLSGGSGGRASRGWQVTAVDFSAVGLDKARRLAEDRGGAADWVRADVRDYQPEPGSIQLSPKPLWVSSICHQQSPARGRPGRKRRRADHGVAPAIANAPDSVSGQASPRASRECSRVLSHPDR